MKKLFAIFLLSVFVLCCFVSCAKAEEQPEAVSSASVSGSHEVSDVVDVLAALPKPVSADDQFSYAYGYLVGYSTLNYDAYPVNLEYMARGLEDAGNPERSFWSIEELNEIIVNYRTKMEAAQREKAAAQAKTNLESAEAFLETNGKRENVRTTESGLQYEVLREGSGPCPTDTDTVTVDYELTLPDGAVADSSYSRGTPAKFAPNQLIPGMREGLKLMNVGSKYRFWVHPSLGYGEGGAGNIGPNSLLIFDFEVHAIN